MRPNESFVGQPIRSLQTMLRVILEQEGIQASIIPDGIYGTDTISAVSAFQRRSGLPVTGVTNQETWDAIVRKYEPALVEQSEAQPLNIILNPGQIIRRQERNPNLFLVQAILAVLSEFYASVPLPSMNGVLDLPTAESLTAFQRLSMLPATGEVNKATWKALALQYPVAANMVQDGMRM